MTERRIDLPGARGETRSFPKRERVDAAYAENTRRITIDPTRCALLLLLSPTLLFSARPGASPLYLLLGRDFSQLIPAG